MAIYTADFMLQVLCMLQVVLYATDSVVCYRCIVHYKVALQVTVGIACYRRHSRLEILQVTGSFAHGRVRTLGRAVEASAISSLLHAMHFHSESGSAGSEQTHQTLVLFGLLIFCCPLWFLAGFSGWVAW